MDNQAGVKFSVNQQCTQRCKLIENRFLQCRDSILRGLYEIGHIPGTKNGQNLLTKVLMRVAFELECLYLGIVEVSADIDMSEPLTEEVLNQIVKDYEEKEKQYK